MVSQTYTPVSCAHPGETVLDYLDSFGWSQRDLSRRSGLTPKTVSEICSGKAPISTATSIAFEKVFGRPAHFWISLQSKYDEIRARQKEAESSKHWCSWLKNFPVKEMKKRGWIDSKNPSEIDAVLSFLGVSSPDSWNAVWEASKVTYRQTRKFETNDFAISAWVRAVEMAAEEIDVDVHQYNQARLKESIEELRAATRLKFDNGLKTTQELLAKSGVAFVWVPALPKTGVSGCTRWMGNKKVIVAISLRYKTDDQIWFTVFHELGHVLLHRNKHQLILDNADDSLTDGIVDPEMQKLEDEANRFSSDTLIPPDLLSKFLKFGLYNDNDAIHEFSEAIGIAPGIVIGRLQREGLLQPHEGNTLKQRIDWSYGSQEG